MSILIKNINAVDSERSIQTDIFIDGGIIKQIAENISIAADTVIDGTGLTIMPGIFDMHVHFRDPGLTYKEDILTGCRAALAGGVTSVMCMPNTIPRIDNPDTVKYIADRAKDAGVDVFTAGCITKSMEGKILCDYGVLKDAGVIALSDDGMPVEKADMMLNALRLSKDNGLLIVSHCEDLAIIGDGIINKGAVSEKLGIPGMDRISEDSVTEREIQLAESIDARVHIAHVSTNGSIDIIRRAKERGVKVTCETCPHYFMFTEEKLLTMDADYRMNPPLRTDEDVQAVIAGIIDGTVDCIVTDHAPHTRKEKADFRKAPNGVVGLETSLAAALTALYHTGKVSLNKIASLMSERPRRILGLKPIFINEGETADLVIVDLDREWTVQPEKFRSKSCNTPFKGITLKGKPIITISKGVKVCHLTDLLTES